MTWPTAAARVAGLRDDPIEDLQARPPQWVHDALGLHAEPFDAGPGVSVLASGVLAMLTTTVVDATDMPAETLRAEVADAYRRIERALGSMARAPVRFWNYIPAIGQAMGQGLDRYMAFNSGRYDAFARNHDGARPFFAFPIATASAVGVGGTALVVQCLASDQPGTPVENPRQTSSWRYSERYGPTPPCFSRATIASLGGRTRLLVGGTASIVGEHSLHERDVTAQLQETLRNIGALVAAARNQSETEAQSLGRLRDLRVYAEDDDVASVVRRELATRCPNAERIEIVRARVCRPELLLEIEGVADL